MKKKKTILFIISGICITALVVTLIIIRENSIAYTDKWRKSSFECVENEKAALLELYGMYENKEITWIGVLDSTDIKEHSIELEYNNKNYYIDLPENQAIDSATNTYLRACEIVDHLIEVYKIKRITYYKSGGILELWFTDSTFDQNYALVYYSPGYLAENHIKSSDEEYFEGIEDGFYFYILYSGF